ncbi:hypothetical protein G9A89_013577 [Geosiphon pyriformis]|nr:hypothetical protein G9A89_013577 [Geosiphon pyriformis]
MDVCCGNNEKYSTATKFYCHPCVIECFEQPKQQRKWNNKSCLACRTILPNKGMWNDIPGHGKMCDEMCQYIILINNWIHKRTPIDNGWKQALQQLERYLHNKHEI